MASDGDGSVEARVESTYDLERVLAAGDLRADGEELIAPESTEMVVGAKSVGVLHQHRQRRCGSVDSIGCVHYAGHR